MFEIENLAIFISRRLRLEKSVLDWFSILATSLKITLKQFITDHKRRNRNRKKKETFWSLRSPLRRLLWQSLHFRFSIHTEFAKTLVWIWLKDALCCNNNKKASSYVTRQFHLYFLVDFSFHSKLSQPSSWLAYSSQNRQQHKLVFIFMYSRLDQVCMKLGESEKQNRDKTNLHFQYIRSRFHLFFCFHFTHAQLCFATISTRMTEWHQVSSHWSVYRLSIENTRITLFSPKLNPTGRG